MQNQPDPVLENFERGTGHLLAAVVGIAREYGNQQDVTEAETLVADHQRSAQARRIMWCSAGGVRTFAEHADGLLGRAKEIAHRLETRRSSGTFDE